MPGIRHPLSSQPIASGETMKRSFHLFVRLLLIAGLVFAPLFASLRAQEGLKAKAFAPENHVELKDTVSGSYFIARPLKEQYDKLLTRLRSLQADIESERTSGAEALRNLKELQTDLGRLRAEIEEKKLFVPVAKTHVQTDTTTFDLGKERLLVITADNIRLVGWDGPGVKCELEKTVLSADGKLDEAELKGLKVVHKYGLAPDKVGRKQAENDAEEAAFRKSKESQGLSPKALEGRRKLVSEIQGHYAIYRDFQGREIDTLELEGLTHQQGNRQMTLEITAPGPGGGETHRSVWRRHARLTVYVPACKGVAIRGGLESLDVERVQGDLVLTGDDSHNRDYYGESRVRKLNGSLMMRNIPLHQIEDVSGNVMITATGDFSNSGTMHDGGSEPGQVLRTYHRFRPLPCSVKNIQGDLQAWFGRVDLELENIAGRLDVRNDFGDTKLKVSRPLTTQAHRVVTDAGRIELSTSKAAWTGLPLWAATQFGNVRTNASQELLDSFSTTLGHDGDGVSRNWAGFRSPRKEEDKAGADYFDSLSRPDKALRAQSRPAGLDLISRGGTVVVTVEP